MKTKLALLFMLVILALTAATTASARVIRDYHPQFGYCGPAVVGTYRLEWTGGGYNLWQCIYLYEWMDNDYYQWWDIPGE